MSGRMKIDVLQPEFVESLPDQLSEGVLYISERFRLCSHKCCCGCGEQVVTPLSPAEWKLTREGALVSLWPSIGNWDYACRSHYFVRRNQVVEALPMTERQIARVHQRDAGDLARMMASNNAEKDLQRALDEAPVPSVTPARESDSVAARRREDGLLQALWRALFRD
jgi:hypothetical protein